MRSLTASLLAACLSLPALPVSAGAPPDEGVSAAAAAATPEDGANQAGTDDESAEQDLEARLTAVDGPVYVHLADHKEGQYTRAEADMPVSSGDEIRVGTGGSAELTLDGNTVIQLAPNTDFIVNSLAPASTEFHLGLGSIVAKIKHLVQGRSMEFHTPTAVAAVRGTELGVSQGEGSEPSRVGVFDEGNVSVRGADGGGEVHLGPHQETQASAGKGPAAPGAMSWWNAHKGRMEQARARQQHWLAQWHPVSQEQRRAARQRLLRRRAMSRESLKGLSAQQKRQAYRAQRQRQKALRAQAQQRGQQRMKARQQRRERQERLQENRERRERREQRRQDRSRHGQKARGPVDPPGRRGRVARQERRR